MVVEPQKRMTGNECEEKEPTATIGYLQAGVRQYITTYGPIASTDKPRKERDRKAPLFIRSRSERASTGIGPDTSARLQGRHVLPYNNMRDIVNSDRLQDGIELERSLCRQVEKVWVVSMRRNDRRRVCDERFDAAATNRGHKACNYEWRRAEA